MKQIITAIFLASVVSGCASINFDGEYGDGVVYFEPVPHFLVSVTEKCVTTGTVVIIPGKKRTMTFSSGYGASELSASFADGVITSVGQNVDSKIPETLTAVATGAAAFDAGEGACRPGAQLYPIKDGKPDLNDPVMFNIN